MRANLSKSFWLPAAELGGWEPLVGLSKATMARRAREQTELDLVAFERLGRLMEVVSLTYSVFEEAASTETWLEAPHPLLDQTAHCISVAPQSARDRYFVCSKSWSRAPV